MKKRDKVAFDKLLGGTSFYCLGPRANSGELLKMRAKFKIGTAGGYANAVRLDDGDVMLIPDKEKVEISRLPWRGGSKFIRK